jgi:ketosteroid isomerase-like protein
MPSANVEFLRQLIEARSGGDLDWLLKHTDDDVEIHSLFAIGGGPYKGHTGVREWLEGVRVSFGAFRLETDELRERDDRVLTVGRVLWQGRQSGVASQDVFAWVCDFRAGRLLRLIAYPDANSARKAFERSARGAR